MWLEIVLFLVMEATLATAPQYGDDGSDFDVLNELNPSEEMLARRNVSVNIHPDDIEVVKGAIKKLLGRGELEHIKYHEPTTPTRSPPTDEATQRPTKTSAKTSATFLPSQTEPYRLVSGRSNATRLETQSHPTRSDATQKLDWHESQGTTPTTMTSSDGLMLPLAASMAARNMSGTPAITARNMSGIPAMMARNMSGTPAMTTQNMSTTPAMTPDPIGEDAADTPEWDNATMTSSPTIVSASAAPSVSDLYVPLRLGFDNRTRFTRRTIAYTRNTLCTESDEECRTMCFDKEKYRVSCPTTTLRPTTPYLDITRLLSMLSSLVADYDTNLTAVMNHTLHLKGYKQCVPTTTTATTTTTVPPPTPPMYDYEPSNQTGSVIAKCYVCGMEELGIPRDAHCADPFAKELLPPAMPDHQAETKRKGFRKYCNYMEMRPWYINGSGIWGKWSGGCAVRWVDLSGVYTQRVCRIRDRPAVGRHLVSKRLAKLEYALRKVDNGCILSPMATLVPFSRGMSLYARLHVCVCSANWCNPARRPASLPWLWVTMTLGSWGVIL